MVRGAIVCLAERTLGEHPNSEKCLSNNKTIKQDKKWVLHKLACKHMHNFTSSAIPHTSVLCRVKHSLHSYWPRWFFMKYGSCERFTWSLICLWLLHINIPCWCLSFPWRVFSASLFCLGCFRTILPPHRLPSWIQHGFGSPCFQFKLSYLFSRTHVWSLRGRAWLT